MSKVDQSQLHIHEVLPLHWPNHLTKYAIYELVPKETWPLGYKSFLLLNSADHEFSMISF